MRSGLGGRAGRMQVISLRVQDGGGFKICGCGAEADKKFQLAQDSNMCQTLSVVGHKSYNPVLLAWNER